MITNTYGSFVAAVFGKEEIPYSVKIMRCVNINIKEGDGLPSMICENCVTELAITYEFVQKCETSDKALRNLSADFFDEIKPKIEIDIKLEDIKRELGVPECFENYFSDVESDKAHNTPEEKSKHNERKKTVKKKFKRGRVGPIQCVVCGLLVTSPSAMQNHMRTHTGEKPFVCSCCDSRFPTKGSLKRHHDTYHAERERECTKTFPTATMLEFHLLKLHTNHTPYMCQYCSRGFYRTSDLSRHLRGGSLRALWMPAGKNSGTGLNSTLNQSHYSSQPLPENDSPCPLQPMYGKRTAGNVVPLTLAPISREVIREAVSPRPADATHVPLRQSSIVQRPRQVSAP
ncbi:unnamed protein product, partial [Iphiclides podalirius]